MPEPTVLVVFAHCVAELYPDGEDPKVITRFPDGTEAIACPHDTPAYHAHALEKTGLDDVIRYCWQHELMHIIVGEMAGGPSVVLWRLAHGEPMGTPECETEELRAQQLQRLFQMQSDPTQQ